MKMTLAKRRQTVARPKADSGKCRDNKQEAGDTTREGGERKGDPRTGLVASLGLRRAPLPLLLPSAVSVSLSVLAVYTQNHF